MYCILDNADLIVCLLLSWTNKLIAQKKKINLVTLIVIMFIIKHLKLAIIRPKQWFTIG